MKKILFILATVFSFNLMATTTTLGCFDIRTKAQYIIRISEDRSTMVYSPFTKDSSVLSKNVLVLDLKKNKSSYPYDLLFAGRNANNNLIVVEVRNEQLINGKRTNLTVSYSVDTANIDKETTFNCSVHIDTRYKKSETNKKSYFKF